MKKFISTNLMLSIAALGFIGCTQNTANTNRAVLNTNTNVAIVNSNAINTMNSNMSSNMNDNMNSNMSSNSSGSKELSSSDKAFMDNAIQGGKTEVQLGNVAILHAQSDDVKAFGQKMINDHSKANNELVDLAKQKKVSIPETMSMEQTVKMSDLSKLSGAAFDKAYVKEMVEDHEKDVADFQKEANTGSDPDVKKFAAETLPTLKTHLEMIKNIQSKMK